MNKNYREWRVLGINEKGQIEIISTNTIGTKENEKYGLNYGAGYVNGINELNKICNIFGNGKGAVRGRSINLRDLEKICGINTEEERNNIDNSYGDIYQYRFPTEDEKIGDTQYMQYRKKEFGETEWSEWSNNTCSWQQTFEMRDSSNVKLGINSPGMVELTNTGYWLSLNNNLKVKGKNNLYNMLRLPNDSCWIATTYNECLGSYALFGLYILSGDSASKRQLCGSYPVGQGSNSSGNSNVRPVISISNLVNLEWNSATNQWDIK